MSIFKRFAHAKGHLLENVGYKVFKTATGEVKQQFQDNFLNRLVFNFFRGRPNTPRTTFGEWLYNLAVRKLGSETVENLRLHGWRVPGLTGGWVDSAVRANLVVNAGKAAVAGLINGVVTNFFEYVGVGIGTTAADLTDTALEAERDEAGATNTNHKIATTSRVTTDVTNDTAQWVVTFNFTATLAITESGVFDTSPTGAMLCRQTFSAVNVVSGDSLQITWKVDVD